MDNLKVLNDQLIRMRKMNRYYHQQFLTDVRLIMIVTIAMLIFVNELTFYILPFVSLFGAVLLSFHAHYLIFSRNFSQYLEKAINKENGQNTLIAHELENSCNSIYNRLWSRNLYIWSTQYKLFRFFLLHISIIRNYTNYTYNRNLVVCFRCW